MGRILIARTISVVGLMMTSACGAPDDFSYDSRPGASGTSGCDTDDCPPECPLGSAPNADGICEPVCSNWRASIDMSIPVGLAADETRVIAAGTSSDVDGRPRGAQFFGVETCQGVLDHGVVAVPDQASTAGGAAIVNGAIYVAGSEGIETSSSGFIAELDPQSLKVRSTVPVSIVDFGVRVGDVASTASGVWLTGNAASSKAPEAWVGRFTFGTGVCAKILTGAGVARAIAPREAGAVLVLEKNDVLSMLSFDDASCDPSSCQCQPSGGAIEIGFPGAARTFASDVVIVDRLAHVVGYADNGAEPFGYVLAVDLDSGASAGFVRWDPSATIDALFAGASGGSQLFVAGMSGATGFDDLNDGLAAVLSFELPLVDEASPTWTSSLDATRVQALEIDATRGGVFALGAFRDGRSVLHRCGPDGC